MYKRFTGVVNSLIFIIIIIIIILGLLSFTELHLVLRMDSRLECFWRRSVLFLERLVLTPSALLVAGDCDFHIDEPNSCDARRFLKVLESFDLIQHASEATRKKGHILDLIITRTHEKLVGHCTLDNPFVSDLAVHSLFVVSWGTPG